MTTSPSVQKAKIFKEDDPSIFVLCHFNPKDFTLIRKVKWNESVNIGGDAAEVAFAGGEAQDLTIPFLFDTTSTGEDVRISYAGLLAMTEISPSGLPLIGSGKSEPPRCQFIWGKFLSFTAVISQIEQNFKLFDPYGTPLRAEVKVSFTQVHTKTKGQNPTSRSEVRRVWVVQEGQTIDWIAFQEYGDTAYWRHIAQANNLIDAKTLHPGQVLKLLPLP